MSRGLALREVGSGWGVGRGRVLVKSDFDYDEAPVRAEIAALARHYGGPALDVGTGACACMALVLARHGLQVTAVDHASSKDLCNDTWRRRDEIPPCYERRRLLGPLDVYRFLPGLNCRVCGEATCMAFAFGLLLSNRHLPECTRLQEPSFAEGGRRLAELLGQ